MSDTYLGELEEILIKNEEYLVEGSLNKNKIAELALKSDSDLIDILVSNAKMKKLFFIETRKSVLVFNVERFIQFISNKEFLPDSYTAYKNKIGLAIGQELLSEKKEVVLNWPYKDCVLEGGQDTEDEKRDEVFHNEILASDQIDRLLDEKVLSGFKQYDQDGEQDVAEISNDNLIIRGNNLLALHTIKRRYIGQVRLIYIDPPYYFSSNKKADTFAYNSNFKLSTWLTFMRNRLEVARQLLSEDGAIFVQINDDGAGELEVLLKEVFNRNDQNNFINKITVRTKSPSGFASVNPGVFETAEYIIAFAKDKKEWTYNPQFVPSKYDTNYKWFVENKEDKCEQWRIVDLFDNVAKINGYDNSKEATRALTKSGFEELVEDFALEHADKIYRSTEIGDNAGKDTVKARDDSKKHKDAIYQIQRDGKYDIFIKNGKELAFYSKKVRNIDGVRTPVIQLSNIWTDISYEGIAQEGGVQLKGGKKPEKLIRRIIELASNEGETVLDYHLGSGTTAAVSHKLKRKYIGIEQIEYGDNDALVRLNNVINGDKTGISRQVNWNGGGSFVFCYLMDLGNLFVEKVKRASTDKELEDLLEQAKKSSFLSYKVNPERINYGDKGFNNLSMAYKKQLLLEIVDSNHLYVNYSEIDDADYGISPEDKALNRQFFGA